MSLYYITGISGAGKSSVHDELKKRGYEVHGFDEEKIAGWYNIETGKLGPRQEKAEDRTPEWRAQHTYQIPRDYVEKMALLAKDKTIFLSGVTENDVDMWDLFSRVFALVIDEKTLKDRILNRTNNNFGQNPDELAGILGWQKTAEEDYRDLGAVIIDATRPIEEVVNSILAETAA